jgi:hypothetical protein
MGPRPSPASIQHSSCAGDRTGTAPPLLVNARDFCTSLPPLYMRHDGSGYDDTSSAGPPGCHSGLSAASSEGTWES